MGACDVDAETLRTCGYQEINSMMVGDGQGVSVNLINTWDRLAVTAETVGGTGSALGKTKHVTVWGVPGERGERHWRYDINVSYRDDEIVVLAIRTSYRGAGSQRNSCTSQEGEVVELDPPNEMEMLAALGRSLEEEEDGRFQEEHQGLPRTEGGVDEGKAWTDLSVLSGD